METKLTKEIHDNHKGVWKKLEEKLNNKIVNENNCIMYIELYYERILLCDSEQRGIPLPFNWLYATLSDFFKEEYGIKIIINHIYDHLKFEKRDIDTWYYQIKTIDSRYNNKEWGYKQNRTKNEAKYAAIIKACEIAGGKG
jgi:hypothetical protein